MAKLYFRHGTVGSAKTLNLLSVAHNYERQGKKVIVIKPGFDDRYGEQQVASRAGLHREAHVAMTAQDISYLLCLVAHRVVDLRHVLAHARHPME